VAATAIVVPVIEAEAAVGRWRRAHTRDGDEGMPAHVTLLYPFVDDAQLGDAAIATLRAVLAEFAAFDVRFDAFGWFDAAPGVLYLEPEPARPFLGLIAAIAARFPDHPPYGGAHETVIPHLTVVHTADLDAIAAARDDVGRRLPLLARADAVRVMAHHGGRWRTHTAVALS
jgi:2'-5' RNA ligase